MTILDTNVVDLDIYDLEEFDLDFHQLEGQNASYGLTYQGEKDLYTIKDTAYCAQDTLACLSQKVKKLTTLESQYKDSEYYDAVVDIGDKYAVLYEKDKLMLCNKNHDYQLCLHPEVFTITKNHSCTHMQYVSQVEDGPYFIFACSG